MLAGRIVVHPPLRTSTDDQVLREALADILEVVQDKSGVRLPVSTRVTTRSGSTITSRVCSSPLTTRRPNEPRHHLTSS